MSDLAKPESVEIGIQAFIDTKEQGVQTGEEAEVDDVLMIDIGPVEMKDDNFPIIVVYTLPMDVFLLIMKISVIIIVQITSRGAKMLQGSAASLVSSAPRLPKWLEDEDADVSDGDDDGIFEEDEPDIELTPGETASRRKWKATCDENGFFESNPDDISLCPMERKSGGTGSRGASLQTRVRATPSCRGACSTPRRSKSQRDSVEAFTMCRPQTIASRTSARSTWSSKPTRA